MRYLISLSTSRTYIIIYNNIPIGSVYSILYIVGTI